MYLVRRECGMTLQELAKAVGMEGYKAVASAVKRYENRSRADKAERVLIEQVSVQLKNEEM